MTNPFIKRVKKRFDGFLNLVTGYGTSRDHAEQYNWVDDQPFDRHTLDGLYAQHPVAWKLIDPVVNSSIHNWITIDHAQSEKIEDILYEIRAQDNTTKGLKRSRQHGGSAIYMQIDDGRDPSMPIDFEKATKIISLSVIERHHCHPRYLNRALDPDQYYITNNESEDLNALNLSVVHKDRLIIMKGLEVSTDWMMRNNGWGQSIIQRCRKPLIAYSIAHDIVPNILKDFIRDVIKIDGLVELAAKNDAEAQKAFKDRLDYMFQAQSTINKLVLDKEDEYERSTSSVTGLNDLIRNPERYLVASSGLPHTLILGESPGASLGEGGANQDKDFIKVVNTYQWEKVRPALDKLLYTIQKVYSISSRIKYSFNDIQQQSKLEQAKTVDLMASAIQKLTPLVISPKEAATIFESEEVKTNFILDKIARQAITITSESFSNEENDQNDKEEDDEA